MLGVNGRCGVHIDRMFETDPGDEGHAEHKVKQSLIRDGEDNKRRRECEEQHHHSMDVVTIRIPPVKEGQQQRRN